MFNSLPNDKLLDWSKFKEFSDDKINVNRKLKFGMGRIENIVGKKEKMLVASIFSFSDNVFKEASFMGSLKVVIVW